MKNLILILLVILVVIYLTQKKEKYSMLDSSIYYSSMLNNQPNQRLAWEQFADLSEEMDKKILDSLKDMDNAMADFLSNPNTKTQKMVEERVKGIKASIGELIQKLNRGEIKPSPELIQKVKGMLSDLVSIGAKIGPDAEKRAKNISETILSRLVEYFSMLVSSIF